MARRRENFDRAIKSRSVPGSMKICIDMARARAVERGRDFDLTLSAMMAMFVKQGGRCAITGRELVWQRGGEEEDQDLMTIDRIDSSGGYTVDNVQLVTLWANRAKNAVSSEEFVAMCSDVLTGRLSRKS